MNVAPRALKPGHGLVDCPCGGVIEFVAAEVRAGNPVACPTCGERFEMTLPDAVKTDAGHHKPLRQ